jgi:hypothetical protein
LGTVALALTVALGAAAPALAQEQVTLVKRDGSRVTGRFEAWNRNNDSFYLRLSLADQRVIPLRDTAYFELGNTADTPPANEADAARGSDHVLVLSNGEILRGRLTNVEGGEGSGKDNEPRMLTFQANGGERRLPFNQVRRLYLGNLPQTTATTATAEPLQETGMPAGAIRVAANAGWVRTGVQVRRNDMVQFASEGQVQLSADPSDRAGTAGSTKGRYAGTAPAPTLLAGALIGRIGGGAPFAIGDQSQALAMPGDGELFLAVNDDHFDDNQGAFAVTIRRARRR